MTTMNYDIKAKEQLKEQLHVHCLHISADIQKL